MFRPPTTSDLPKLAAGGKKRDHRLGLLISQLLDSSLLSKEN